MVFPTPDSRYFKLRFLVVVVIIVVVAVVVAVVVVVVLVVAVVGGGEGQLLLIFTYCHRLTCVLSYFTDAFFQCLFAHLLRYPTQAPSLLQVSCVRLQTPQLLSSMPSGQSILAIRREG